MIMQDKMEKERADSKNAVEEYVYEMRDKLSGALSEFMIDAVRRFFHACHKHMYRETPFKL